MPEPESHSEGIISKSEIAVFAELFDQFEFAEDPRSAKACEAKQKFDADARILFEERVKPNFLSCSEEAFEAGLTGLLQLAAFCFRTIKSWSRFAGDFRSPTSKCSAK